jgi:pyruvate dehydrogenase E1 component alpha subunit
LKEIQQQVQSRIDDAVEFAEQSPEPDASELYRFVFTDD